MAKTLEIDATKSVIVAEVDGKGGVNRWSMRPDQAEKHLETFAAQPQKLAPGDVSVIRDAAADFKAAQALNAKNL